MKLCTKFERNRAIRGGVIATLVFHLMTLNIALRVALGSEIIITKFDLRQVKRAWIIAFFHADFDLWPLTFDLLTLKVRGTSSVTWSKCLRNLSETPRLFAHVMSRCDLDLWPLELELFQHFRVSCVKTLYKIRAKSNSHKSSMLSVCLYCLCSFFCSAEWRINVRIIDGWVIDDLARFASRHAIFGGRSFLPNGSQGCVDPPSPNLAEA